MESEPNRRSSRRRLIGIAGAVLLLPGLVALLVLPGSRHPRFKGRNAWQWLEYGARIRDIDGGALDRTYDAMHHLGTNAIPAIADAYLGTFPRRWHERLLRSLAPRVPNGNITVTRDVLIRDTARECTRSAGRDLRVPLAQIVLGRLATNASLDRLRSSPDDPIMAVIDDLAIDPILVNRTLLALAQSPEIGIHTVALSLLPRYGDALGTLVPELAAAASPTNRAPLETRAYVLERLARLGPAAQGAIPELRSMLAADHLQTLAAIALWRIAGDAQQILPTLARNAQNNDFGQFQVLAEIGAAARTMIPSLTSNLASTNVALRVDSAGLLAQLAPDRAPSLRHLLAEVLIEKATNSPRYVFTPSEPFARAATLLRTLDARDSFAIEALNAAAVCESPAITLASRETLSGFQLPWPPRRPVLESWFGRTPTLDGVISPNEWNDAAELRGAMQWIPEFLPVTHAHDLNLLRGHVKHDETHLYFLFWIHDDLFYGIDTPRWLPPENPKAHELSRDGFPWFGDEIEILLNASNRWRGDESADGDGGSWQMVCNLTKSRLGGIGTGGLLEGEPRSDPRAWENYQRWIQSGAQRAAVKADRSWNSYIIEWAIRFNPCVEIAPGEFYDPKLGNVTVGLNLAIGDLDTPAHGPGQFGHFHHEQWWAGSKGTRTQKNNFGTLHLMGRRTRPSF